MSRKNTSPDPQGGHDFLTSSPSLRVQCSSLGRVLVARFCERIQEPRMTLRRCLRERKNCGSKIREAVTTWWRLLSRGQEISSSGKTSPGTEGERRALDSVGLDF